MKDKLVKHLKTKCVFDVNSLWGETKSYYRNNSIQMGGSYSSSGNNINVILSVEGELKRFKVEVDECI